MVAIRGFIIALKLAGVSVASLLNRLPNFTADKKFCQLDVIDRASYWIWTKSAGVNGGSLVLLTYSHLHNWRRDRSVRPAPPPSSRPFHRPTVQSAKPFLVDMWSGQLGQPSLVCRTQRPESRIGQHWLPRLTLAYLTPDTRVSGGNIHFRCSYQCSNWMRSGRPRYRM